MQQVYKSIDELPAMLTVKDLMQFFGIGQVQAYTLVRSEGFPAIKVGGLIRTPKRELIAWIDKEISEGVKDEWCT